MPKLDANNYRVYIEGVTPGTLAEIRGQRTSSCDTQSNTYSTATKDSGNWDTFNYGQNSGNLSVECVPDLPDATGFTRAETLHNTRAAARVQWRKAPFAPGDVVFDAPCIVTGINRAYPFNDVVGAQVSFQLNGQPTVNTLT